MSMESFLPGEILDVILASVFVLATFTTSTMQIWIMVSSTPCLSITQTHPTDFYKSRF